MNISRAAPARALVLAILPVLGDAAQPLRLRVAAEAPETVYRWATQRCEDADIPDSPARAFRSADGRVTLFAAHYNNRPFTGPSLDRVAPDCGLGGQASMDPAPARYDARIWWQSFYTEDGRRVHALGSADYHGSWFGRCKGTPGNPKCWWSAIASAQSIDGGRSFHMPAPPAHVIARAPFGYSDAAARPTGFFTTSNIVRLPGGYHAFAYTFGYPGQPAGNCLIRARRLGAQPAWRAWNGRTYGVDLAQEGHAPCTVIPVLPGPVRALVRHAASGRYIAIGATRERIRPAHAAPGTEAVRVRFVYASSLDLYDWTPPRTLVQIDSAPCGKPVPAVDYPSILDPSSEDMNFGTAGSRPYLYYTRFNSRSGCTRGMDRDLLRMALVLDTPAAE